MDYHVNFSDSEGESDIEDVLGKVQLPHDIQQRHAKRKAYKRHWQQRVRGQKRREGMVACIGTEMEKLDDSSDDREQDIVLNQLIESESNAAETGPVNISQDVSLSPVPIECSDGAVNPIDIFDSDDDFSVGRIHETEDRLAEIKLNGAMYSDEEDVRELADDVLPNQSRDSAGTLWADIREAAYMSRMNTIQIDAILSVLFKHRTQMHVSDLPKSHKTLMRTGSDRFMVHVRIVSGHQYHYYPLAKQIRFYLARYPEDVVARIDKLCLVWNTDGLPLYNSRRLCSWPVLCTISNLKPRVVFEVVLTAGEGKPTNQDYLLEFINDLKCLMEDGLEWRGKLYSVIMTAAVCDAPARATIKHTKQFMARYGCDHCQKRGEHDGKRMVWVGCGGAVPRTDASFRSKQQPEYHRDDGMCTPLLTLDIDMVSCFPPDFMHQGGGTMKKNPTLDDQRSQEEW